MSPVTFSSIYIRRANVLDDARIRQALSNLDDDRLEVETWARCPGWKPCLRFADKGGIAVRWTAG